MFFKIQFLQLEHEIFFWMILLLFSSGAGSICLVRKNKG